MNTKKHELCIASEEFMYHECSYAYFKGSIYSLLPSLYDSGLFSRSMTLYVS
jgi:hypothetical protein